MISKSSSAIAFPASVKMPPSYLTTSITTLKGGLYGDGTYETSESSALQGRQDSKAFNAFRPSGMWHSEILFNATSGLHIGSAKTMIGSTRYRGEWIQVRFPYPVSLDSYTITPRADLTNARSPRNFVVMGSNNVSTWTLIHNQTNINSWWDSSSKSFKPPSSSPAFRFFRLAVSRVGNFDKGITQNSVNLVQWEIIATATKEDLFFAEADTASSVRLQSVKFPNSYLRVNDRLLQVSRESSEDPSFRNASLFQIANRFGGLPLSITSN
jgi:hypothetical protein